METDGFSLEEEEEEKRLSEGDQDLSETEVIYLEFVFETPLPVKLLKSFVFKMPLNCHFEIMTS